MSERMMALTVETGWDVPDVAVTVTDTGAGSVVVNWTDGATGEWTETFSTLSAALARVALLARCGEDGWERGLLDTDVTVSAFELFVNAATAK